VKIRMLKRLAGPDGNLAPGSIVELPDEQAQMLINAGAAERIDRDEPETAMLEVAPERMIRPRARKRRGGKKGESI